MKKKNSEIAGKEGDISLNGKDQLKTNKISESSNKSDLVIWR